MLLNNLHLSLITFDRNYRLLYLPPILCNDIRQIISFFISFRQALVLGIAVSINSQLVTRQGDQLINITRQYNQANTFLFCRDIKLT